MRLLTPVLCVLLALAAAGRFKAEAGVREARGDLAAVEAALAEAEDRGERLRLEVEVLESPTRFEEVNEQTLRLEAPRAEQLTTYEDFSEMVGRPVSGPGAPADSDVIGNAITFSDPAAGQPESGL